VVVHAAAGGVGTLAIQLAKRWGAGRVIAAASSEAKLELCRERGADETIDYTTDDLKVRAKELTDGQGVDVVYDCVGGKRAEQALRAIAWEGRFLVIGFAAGIPSIPLNLALLKSCQIVGVFYGAMTVRDPALNRSIGDELLDLVAKGELQPYVSGRYPLERAGEALRTVEEGHARGKIVVTVLAA
jgi:NADPH2:quinone reductase